MAPEEFDLPWRKSSYSADNGTCVELAPMPDGRVALRDSKTPSADVLYFTRAEMLAFVRGARHGEFDDLT